MAQSRNANWYVCLFLMYFIADLLPSRMGSVSKVDFTFASQIVDAGRIGFNMMTYLAIFGMLDFILPRFDT